ncbi:UNVERIFIED_CONTAM: hypothetical protein HDU68_010186 [Siphonaria sp. JEL0065]|nr:hypothetical protein HDU68_010186 [Siphonaria sp. JEL0065]
MEITQCRPPPLTLHELKSSDTLLGTETSPTIYDGYSPGTVSPIGGVNASFNQQHEEGELTRIKNLKDIYSTYRDQVNAKRELNELPMSLESTKSQMTELQDKLSQLEALVIEKDIQATAYSLKIQTLEQELGKSIQRNVELAHESEAQDYTILALKGKLVGHVLRYGFYAKAVVGRY